MDTQQIEKTPEAQRADKPSADEFDALYRSSRDDLFSYLTYLVGDRSTAEELTAKAFETAFRKRNLFRPVRGDLRGWLFGIARNAALDELRRGKSEVALDFAHEPVDPSAGAGGSDERMVLVAAMRKLQARDRELIALKFFAGLENEQIARTVGISRSNAGTQLHRAIGRLRDLMEVDDATR